MSKPTHPGFRHGGGFAVVPVVVVWVVAGARGFQRLLDLELSQPVFGGVHGRDDGLGALVREQRRGGDRLARLSHPGGLRHERRRCSTF